MSWITTHLEIVIIVILTLLAAIVILQQRRTPQSTAAWLLFIIALPWVAAELQDTVDLMGPDYWKYGIEECRHEIEALARYSYNDGLSERLLTPEDLFAESTFDISRI